MKMRGGPDCSDKWTACLLHCGGEYCSLSVALGKFSLSLDAESRVCVPSVAKYSNGNRQELL